MHQAPPRSLQQCTLGVCQDDRGRVLGAAEGDDVTGRQPCDKETSTSRKKRAVHAGDRKQHRGHKSDLNFPACDNQVTVMKTTFGTILHPTDFSDSARFALEVACSLAREHRARLDHSENASPAEPRYPPPALRWSPSPGTACTASTSAIPDRNRARHPSRPSRGLLLRRRAMRHAGTFALVDRLGFAGGSMERHR